MRTFIAIEIPEKIRAEIFHIFEKINGTNLISGNFVEKDNLHLTLKFLGELTGEQLQKVKEKLSEINFSKFDLETDGIGFFPNENYIRVMWVGLKGAKLLQLQKIIEDKVYEVGIRKDDKAFSSHLTVARIKNIKNKTLFLEKIKNLRIKEESFSVKNFSLFKSELIENETRYKKIQDFSL